jgi:hypothetical protein
LCDGDGWVEEIRCEVDGVRRVRRGCGVDVISAVVSR